MRSCYQNSSSSLLCFPSIQCCEGEPLTSKTPDIPGSGYIPATSKHVGVCAGDHVPNGMASSWTADADPLLSDMPGSSCADAIGARPRLRLRLGTMAATLVPSLSNVAVDTRHLGRDRNIAHAPEGVGWFQVAGSCGGPAFLKGLPFMWFPGMIVYMLHLLSTVCPFKQLPG